MDLEKFAITPDADDDTGHRVYYQTTGGQWRWLILTHRGVWTALMALLSSEFSQESVHPIYIEFRNEDFELKDICR
jgi:hypothetical protein